MKVNGFSLSELERLIIHSKDITPQAKGQLGIIIFKLKSKLELDLEEQSFLDDIMSFLRVS
ncbi:hypothetical protein [Robertmurraya massiliosenegalensis]|uniref:hypothetical protein n=1 Tax=Robertmurraya massiliosenegalensis TaxID=1287657 RepID=UPI00036CC198|nr:hypothetical protein [Robertmurraya massiliosenegalensis]